MIPMSTTTLLRCTADQCHRIWGPGRQICTCGSMDFEEIGLGGGDE